MLPTEENNPKNVGVTQGSHQFNYSSEITEMKQHNFDVTYSLFITSDNQNEVILIYHFLKTIILSAYEQFSFRGLNNLWISGRDVTIDFDLEPMVAYHRTVAMSFHYNNTVADIHKMVVPTAADFVGTKVDVPNS